MVVVDTNILVYAADRTSPFHSACNDWLEARRRQPDAWYTTWPVVYEFLRVATHPRVLRHPWTAGRAWECVVRLLAAPGAGVLVQTERHADVAARLLAEHPELAGNVIHDAHTAVLMREHGIARICTRDTDFHRFPYLEVIDPLRA